MIVSKNKDYIDKDNLELIINKLKNVTLFIFIQNFRCKKFDFCVQIEIWVMSYSLTMT